MAVYIKTKFGLGESINKMITWTDKENLGNGIVCYRNVIKPELDIINKLESNLAAVGEQAGYAWQPAYVGYKQLLPEYRDCADFKFKKTDIQYDRSEKGLALQDLWQSVYAVSYTHLTLPTNREV